jgi:hypothetical protein
MESEWKDSIVTTGAAAQIDAPRLVRSVDVFMAANEALFYNFNGSAKSIRAYQILDRARVALLTGDFDGFDRYIQDFLAAFGK